MARIDTSKKCERLLMLQGRILLRNQGGKITDVTEDSAYSLEELAEDGSLVIDIIDRCRKRLELLYIATEHRSQIDSSLVRLAVEDLRVDLEQGSVLAGYLHMTQEMFEHSEALPPQPTPDSRNRNLSLRLINPTS